MIINIFFYKLIEYNIDVPDEIKNFMKNNFKRYYRINGELFNKLYKRNIISFTDDEKTKIDEVIHNSKKSHNYYQYDKFHKDGIVSLYVYTEEEEYKINKYKDHILITINNENIDMEMVSNGYFICLDINQLIEFLDDYYIMANKKD